MVAAIGFVDLRSQGPDNTPFHFVGLRSPSSHDKYTACLVNGTPGVHAQPKCAFHRSECAFELSLTPNEVLLHGIEVPPLVHCMLELIYLSHGLTCSPVAESHGESHVRSDSNRPLVHRVRNYGGYGAEASSPVYISSYAVHDAVARTVLNAVVVVTTRPQTMPPRGRV